MLVLCIAACAVPFVAIMIFRGQASLSWLGLLACVGMHLVMMKMMPGHKSCHGNTKDSDESTNKVTPSAEKPSTASLDA